MPLSDFLRTLMMLGFEGFSKKGAAFNNSLTVYYYSSGEKCSSKVFICVQIERRRFA
jgi:hypothetical protein